MASCDGEVERARNVTALVASSSILKENVPLA